MYPYFLLSILAFILAACSNSPQPIEQTQTAVAVQQQQLDMTRVALSLGPTQTALAVQSAQLAATQTREAVVYISHNTDWTPVERDFDGVTMTLVPAGCFMMGFDRSQLDGVVQEINFKHEQTDIPKQTLFEQTVNSDAHEICFDQPFWIDKYEVTNAQYAKFIEAGGYDDADYWTELGLRWRSSMSQPVNWGDIDQENENLPVFGLSWYEAVAYSNWRGCDLPTEAEWEYAARGPDSLIYPWGNEWISENAIVPETYEMLAAAGTIEAGASWVGALDMSGSLWEWTNSFYMPYPYDAMDGREQTEVAENDLRVARGAAYYGYNPFNLGAAYRGSLYPDDPVGGSLRCARSDDES